MLAVLVCACFGSVDQLASSDSGPGLTTGDAGPVIDSGSVTPLDAGSTVDAGRVLSTDGGDFYGAPRCGTAGVLFCDDFEGRADQAAPDPSSWAPEYWDPSTASVKIDATRAARGSKSARFTIGRGSNKAMMSLKNPFPIVGNTFWVRLFLYMDTVPLPFKYNDTANFPLTHWTFAQASGPHVFTASTKRPELRAGGFINTALLMNEDGMDRPEVGLDDSAAPAGQTAFQAKKWVCFEMEWNGPDQELRLFWDGVEHPGLHVTKTHTGGTNNSNPPWPMADPFDTLTVGLVMYQPYDKIGATIDVNIDELALDPQRIGCSR